MNKKVEGRNIGKYSRNKGHALERRLAKTFRQVLGFEFCKTSRAASKLLDDSKVDLAFIPYNVQCKAGYIKGLNYTEIFDEMEAALLKNYPPDDKQHSYPSMIFHDKGRKSSEKLVIMKEKEFIELLKIIYEQSN